jgi:hypothetical protein
VIERKDAAYIGIDVIARSGPHAMTARSDERVWPVI